MGIFVKVLVALSVLSHYPYSEKKSEETAGNCSPFVVSPPHRQTQTDAFWTDSYSLGSEQTPFKRSNLSGQDPCSCSSSNDEKTSFVEVLDLSRRDEGRVSQMLEMWIRMESMSRFFLCAARVQAGLRPAERAAASMEWCFMAISRQWLEKPSYKGTEAQPSRTSSRGRSSIPGQRVWQRAVTSANASHDAYDATVSTAYDASSITTSCGADAGVITYDGQGHRQGDGSFHCYDSTTATHAIYRNNVTATGSSRYVDCQYVYDAFPDGSPGTGCSSATGVSIQRGTSAKESESPAERAQKGRGHFVSSSSVNGARNEKTRRKEQHERTALGGSCLRRRKGCIAGSRKRKSPVALTVETLFATICSKVEGIHYELPSFRFSPPCQCTSSSFGSSQSSAHLRPRFETGARGQEQALAHFRRGGGGHRGHDGGHQGGECAENSRWYVLHSDEPRGTVILGRSPRAEGQEAKDYRHQRRSSGAVFWQGRRYVTDEYSRQGPLLLPVMDIQAVRLHWSHSILQERDFLPEWQAQTHASTLAAEMGYNEQLVIDVFALPFRRRSRRSSVTFDENIVVYMGLYDNSAFSQVSMQHTTLSSWKGKPWTVRAVQEPHFESVPEAGPFEWTDVTGASSLE